MAHIEELLTLMARLRDPEHGCPWDLQQTYATIAPYTIEEAYEVADAIARHDLDELRDELGDLLLQVVFHAQMAREEGVFEFADVVRAIVDKMTRRHPHVFGEVRYADVDEQKRAWDDIKSAERGTTTEQRVLSGVPLALPALTRAAKLQRKAARVGFDWSELPPVLAKIEEEIGEIRAELADGAVPERVTDEIGDLLFACVNLARHTNVDPEAALRAANAKFERRFGYIETALRAENRRPEQATLAEMDALWEQAKTAERTITSED